MKVELDNWLTEHQETLLSRWVSSLAELTINGDGTPPEHTYEHEYQHSHQHGYVQPHSNESPFSHLQAEDISNRLGHLYTGLVEAARGDLSYLTNHLETIVLVNGTQHVRLPDLLNLSFQFRRLVWDVALHEQTDPQHTFTLMNDLEDLLEQAVGAMAESWQQTTETEIQERISQAEFIAESMASAIEQADRTALQLSSLNEVSQQLSASLENTNQLIDKVGATMEELIGATHISIWFPEEIETSPDENLDVCMLSLYATHCWGTHQQNLHDMCVHTWSKDDIIAQSYRSSRTIHQIHPNDTRQGDWYISGYSVLAIPLLVKERACGVVVLQDPNPEEQFSRSQLDLSRAVVNQAAIAIENARLYSRIRNFNNELGKMVDMRTSELQAEKERLATIHQISTEISSTLDLDNLLRTSLDALARITQVEYGSIMLVEPDTGHLVNRAVLGQETVNTFTRFPIGKGVAGWVAQHKEPALIEDVNKDERWVKLPDSEAEMESKYQGSMVAVPLIAQGEVWGVLILSHSQPGYFNEDHLRLLTASASSIAVGINNANMYTTIFSEMERNSILLQRQHNETSKMEAILQSLSDGVLVCDTEGEILSANLAVGPILQRDIEDLYMGGTTLPDILHDLLGQRIGEMPLEDLLAHPLDNSNEPRVFTTTVQIHMQVISLTLGPVLKDGNELLGALLLMHDITREVEADRLKTEFIGTMSHELRTPMTAIKGFTQLLAMGGLGPVNDTQREFLNTIQNNAERMISIINDVLDITKIETGSIELELRSIHLAEALSGVVMELQNLTQSREHVLTLNIPSGLPLVRADVGRLNQILHNILSNALKYTPTGGQIWIDAQEAIYEELPDKVRTHMVKGRRYIQVSIRDTGVGIAPHELDLVFDRFYRTENQLKVEAGGTGLGLSLVKPLVELHGGRIWVDSVLNEGSTFSFIMPVADL